MAGVYQALSEGLSTGFNLARTGQLDEQAKKQREFENTRQTESDKRAEQDLALRRDTEARQQKRLDTAARAATVKEGIAAGEADIAAT